MTAFLHSKLITVTLAALGIFFINPFLLSLHK